MRITHSQVLGHVGKPVVLAQVHQIENILFKARSAETDAGLQKPGADAAVLADGIADLGNVRFGLLAQGRYAVDGRDSLRQKRVGRKLGELGAPYVAGDDAGTVDPMGIQVDELFSGRKPGFCFLGADEHPVGVGRSCTAVPSARNSGFDATSK